MRKRTLRGASGIVVTILAVTGCAPAASNSSSQSDAEDVLRVGVPGSTLISLDPALSGSPRGDGSIISAIYGSLTALDQEANLVGDLATSWEQLSDTEWEFTLRDDVFYTNGEQFTADTVVWNYERLSDPDFAASNRGGADRLASVTAVDDLTVRFVTDGPFVDLPYQLTYVYLLDPTWAQDHDPATEALGTGPYTLSEFVSDDRVELAVNPDYYGDAPEYERVTVTSYANTATRLAALKNGELDAVFPVDPIDFIELESVPEIEVGGQQGSRIHTFIFNYDFEPFQDERVREAINYAIDKETIVASIYRGVTVPSRSQVISEWYPGYQEDYEPWPYDLDEARRLLEEAGYADGFKLTVSLPQAIYPGAEQAVQVIAAQLAELNITLDVEVLPSSTWQEKHSSDNAAELLYWGINSRFLSSLQNLQSWTNTKAYIHGDTEGLAEYSDLVARAGKAADSEEYVDYIHSASEILRDRAFAVFLWDQPQTSALSTAVEWPERFDDFLIYELARPVAR